MIVIAKHANSTKITTKQVDSNNFEIKIRGIDKILDRNTWTRINSLYLYFHKASSIFLPPLFAFHPKFEFSLKFTQIRLVHHK